MLNYVKHKSLKNYLNVSGIEIEAIVNTLLFLSKLYKSFYCYLDWVNKKLVLEGNSTGMQLFFYYLL